MSHSSRIKLCAPFVSLFVVFTGSLYLPESILATDQPIKLIPKDGAANDNFGRSVALEGNTAVIGAFNKEYSKGAAYVFSNMEGEWFQQAKLLASDGQVMDLFGFSVAVDGDIALIMAKNDTNVSNRDGSVYTFIRAAGTWTQNTKLDPMPIGTFVNFGVAIDIEESIAVLGAPGDSSVGGGSGSVFIFSHEGDTWTQQVKIIPPDVKESLAFGSSVAIEGNTIVIGAEGNDENGRNSGAVYVFTRCEDSWIFKAKLFPSEPRQGDLFGASVELQGNTIFVGAPGDKNLSPGGGSVYVFTQSGDSWIQEDKLAPSDRTTDDDFGFAIDVEGNILIIGAPADDDKGKRSGSAYIFTRKGDKWIQSKKLRSPGGREGDMFGISVSLSAGKAIVGSPGGDSNGLNSGEAFIFTRLIDVVSPKIESFKYYSRTPAGYNTIEEYEFISSKLAQLAVTFSEDLNNPIGGFKAYDVTNTANYSLIKDGSIPIAINSVRYKNNNGNGPFVAFITLNGGDPLPIGSYSFTIRSQGLVDFGFNPLEKGITFVRNFAIVIFPSLSETPSIHIEPKRNTH